MLTLRRPAAIRALVLTTLAAGAVTTAAPAAARTPIRDCGDLGDSANGSPYAITAQGRGLPCRTARGVASGVGAKRSCRTSGSCVVRGFTCLVARAGKELYLVHCEASNQTRFVRFEFGS
jgi:hypothetical protein